MTAPMTRDEAAQFLAQHGAPDLISLGGWGHLREPAHVVERDRVYKAAARKLHPDAGGSTADFQRLQEAKRVLDGAA